MQRPLQQGLRLVIISHSFRSLPPKIEVQRPLQQGLRPHAGLFLLGLSCTYIEVQRPLQQGLRHYATTAISDSVANELKCNVHYNKDCDQLSFIGVMARLLPRIEVECPLQQGLRLSRLQGIRSRLE